jgi:hypothetical protein
MEGATEDVIPVPLSAITCGLFVALSVRVSVPVRVPAAVGVNFTLMVQLTPGATELPQVPSPAKAKLPVKAALNVSVALPVFVSVVSCAALLVPTVWLPNVNEVGERLAVEVAFTVAANVPITNNETTSIVALKIFSLIFRLIPISLPFQVFYGDSKSPSSSSVGTSNAANA